jgi:hypothetical protein
MQNHREKPKDKDQMSAGVKQTGGDILLYDTPRLLLEKPFSNFEMVMISELLGTLTGRIVH